MRVMPRRVPVTSAPGEYVYVVAEYQGKVLYYAEVEDGWELEELNEAGGVTERRCNQFKLTHSCTNLFGSPDAPSAV